MASGYTAALPSTRLTTKERMSRHAQEAHETLDEQWSATNAEAYDAWFCDVYGVEPAELCDCPTVGPSQCRRLDDTKNMQHADDFDDRAAAEELEFGNRTFAEVTIFDDS
eukprot:CAMPEP_0176441116 /NCGR_PEP_ID=MMETSP0127-20121128/21002_1 /TAXON_ID=938130 /ORGANISM="Platyophrya macrostoma, Strain WH" /LENGTH=109 /DNA_ID=CAMNT_0017825825 /DNA_START=130 /DNA_END=456 /DNA_ORIENTATION=+